MRSLLAVALLLSALFLTMGTPAAQTSLAPDLFSGLEYRHVGPVGNRISAVVGVPGDRNFTTRVRLQGASSRPRMEAPAGRQSSMSSPPSPSGRLPLPLPIRTWCGWAPVKLISAAMSRSAMESTVPPMEDAPGSIWAWKKRAGLHVS